MPEERKIDHDGQPQPEALTVSDENSSMLAGSASKPSAPGSNPTPTKFKKTSYRPSHKATFIGLAVVALIIAANVGIIWFVMRGNEDKTKVSIGEAALNEATLDKLGMNRNNVTDKGIQLTVGPDAKFSGKVTIGNDLNVSSATNLNGKLTANDSSITKLQAGETTINSLTVNGDTKFNKLTVQQSLLVTGTTTFQNGVTMSQLLTVNNNVNVAGSLSVGGNLSVRNFQASSLTSDTTLTIGGHIITRGAAPTVDRGPATGPAGTVSISGSDAVGTVAANVGTGGVPGIIASVTFNRAYGATPRVVVTAVGAGLRNIYVTRSAEGFQIGTNDAPGPGGYAIDYIVIARHTYT